MRAATLAVLVAGLAAARPLAGQTPSDPRLYLSIFGGYRATEQLWSLTDQPFAVFVPSSDSTILTGANVYDTLNLSRHIVPGFIIGVAGTYFPGPHLGFSGEFAFLGMDVESHCSIRQSQPAYPSDVDPSLCADLDGQVEGGSAVSVAVGFVARATPGKGTFPYIRASAGFIARDRSTIQMIGSYVNGDGIASVAVVDEQNPLKTAAQFTIGAGVSVSTGRGYELWLEGRDVIALLDRVSGPASPTDPTGTLFPPHGSRYFHNFVLALGLDVIFEQRRGHRY